jgi:predicted DNA-binding transcriptional regulator AlpA
MSTAPATLPLPSAMAGTTANDAEALVYTGNELAGALRVARKTITRMDQSGKLPRALRISGRKRWRRVEIASWLAAGAPPRRDWERRPECPP